MASLIDGDQKIAGDLLLGNLTAPIVQSAGSGTMNTTNKPNGSIHFRTDEDYLPEVLHNDSAEGIGLAGGCEEARAGNLTANTATTYFTYAPRDLIITGVSRRYTTVPASAGGSVVAGVTAGGNQLLASASEDEEGLSNDTLTAHNLTSTSADLKVSKGDKIVITITSNNADMTGGTECMYYLYYKDN